MKSENIKFMLDLESLDKVNNYIQKGWVLIDTYTTSYDPEYSKNHLTMHYIIGATDDIDYSAELKYQNRF